MRARGIAYFHVSGKNEKIVDGSCVSAVSKIEDKKDFIVYVSLFNAIQSVKRTLTLVDILGYEKAINLIENKPNSIESFAIDEDKYTLKFVKYDSNKIEFNL